MLHFSFLGQFNVRRRVFAEHTVQTDSHVNNVGFLNEDVPEASDPAGSIRRA